MIVQLPHSRNRLEWYRFDQVDSGGWAMRGCLLNRSRR
jgi:hypothetical protein